VATSLIAEMLAEMDRRYGEGHFGVVDPATYRAPAGAFLVAYLDEEPAGCGGLIRVDDSVGEVKRMFVRQAYLRRGIGRAILSAVEARARELGYRELRLETGVRQPEAIGLYRSSGWSAIPCYPPYADDALSVCFGKSLG
jgi:GNAT superfamily N-acetyltransferase